MVAQKVIASLDAVLLPARQVRPTSKRLASRANGRRAEAGATPGHSVFLGKDAGHAYNEAAFRHFLVADRRRVARSKRSLLLVLVALRRSPGRLATLTDAAAIAIFRSLSASLRDVDFVGWYRERHVAAAVLEQGADVPEHVRTLVGERIFPVLQKQLSSHHSSDLRVRVVRLGGSS